MKIVRGYTDVGTFGRWYADNGSFLAYSMERPWVDNAPFTSCIPEGKYGIVDYNSPKFGDTYALVNHELDVGVYEGEAKRFAILIHKANWPRQLHGCVAPGTKLSALDGEWSVSSSGLAYAKVIAEILSGDGTLEITHASGILA